METKKEKIAHLIREIVPLNQVKFHSSGASALREILLEALPNEGDEILVPNFSCERILLSLFSSGRRFQLVNINSNERVTPSLLEYQQAVTPSTKAILLIYPWGYVPSDLFSILEWAKENGFKVIEDIASAFGLSFHGKKLGTLGDYTFGSFGHDKFCSVGGVGFSNIQKYEASSILHNPQRINYQSKIKAYRRYPRFIRGILFSQLSKKFPDFENAVLYNKNLEEKIYALQIRLSGYPQEIGDRKKNQEIYFGALSRIPDCILLKPNNDEGVALRIPFLLPKGTSVEVFLKRMHKDDCWIGRDYPLFLHEWMHRTARVSQINVAGKDLTGRMVNLITNPQNRRVQRIIERIFEECGARSRI